MSKKLVEKNYFSVDTLIDTLDAIYENVEKRKQFEEFYKSFVVKAVESLLLNQSDVLKKITDETEVLSLVIKEKSKDFNEKSKEIYAMGRFEGAYDALGTWSKMYSENEEYEKNMIRILNKRHVKEILYSIKKHPGIQNKDILEAVDIKANHLSELTSEMVNYQIISRYTSGKNSFYELTPRAKEFFRKKERQVFINRINKDKIEMYREPNPYRVRKVYELKPAYFDGYIECNPTYIRKAYIPNENVVLEKGIYNV